MHKVKLIKTGKNQIIRLPKELHVDVDEVYLKKVHEGIVVITRDPWELFHEGCEKLSDDFMAKRKTRPPKKRN